MVNDIRPAQKSRTSRSMLWAVLALGALSVALVAMGSLSAGKSRSGDPREYAQPDGVVRLADRDLVKGVLPQYGIRLPCGVGHLRYAEDVSLVGSGGTLYLRFGTSAVCLNDFLRDLGMARDPAAGPHLTPGGRLDFNVTSAPDSYGWRFDPAVTYSVYECEMSERVRVQVVVDPRAAEPEVFLVALYS